ncbi:STAS domain-containing protein [Stenotrophomonas sp. ATCM1_4]|uniref:STAS domain-containing protein n=1 Tax=Stenotrophomonas capsici TaxID=3110230 RepID=A0ABU5V2W8_9GAMM|nr:MULTISPECIES: STAS domain-containing protein [unclassified Stenotrophomonas]MEA5667163.1 STAS domain-containing protein [Stenotrophomonas sp. MH1]TDB27672.1 STAS domain-containing protein [Stenotrophomonas sp. ATCM1_4]
MASNASARIEGDTLHLAGVLDRAAVTALWPQLARVPGTLRQLDLQLLERVDSAGLAVLGELAARLRAHGPVQVLGAPAGLDELRAAYRLSPSLDFNATAAGS